MCLPLADPTSTSRNQSYSIEIQTKRIFDAKLLGIMVMCYYTMEGLPLRRNLGGNENERRKPTYA